MLPRQNRTWVPGVSTLLFTGRAQPVRADLTLHTSIPRAQEAPLYIPHGVESLILPDELNELLNP